MKPDVVNIGIAASQVAPCVGAWIETINRAEVLGGNVWSHPAWVRGLKPNFVLQGELPLN